MPKHKKTLATLTSDYIDKRIQSTDWVTFADTLKGICADCPSKSVPQPDIDQTHPCYTCPIWAVRIDLEVIVLKKKVGL